MKDETYNKKVLTIEEFGEMLEICIGDLSHAIRHRDEEVIKKVKERFEQLLHEQLPKVATISDTTAFEALFEKYKPHLQALEKDNPTALIQWCANSGLPKVEKLLEIIESVCREPA